MIGRITLYCHREVVGDLSLIDYEVNGIPVTILYTRLIYLISMHFLECRLMIE